MALAPKADHFRNGSMLSKNALLFGVAVWGNVFRLFLAGHRRLTGEHDNRVAKLLRNRRAGGWPRRSAIVLRLGGSVTQAECHASGHRAASHHTWSSCLARRCRQSAAGNGIFAAGDWRAKSGLKTMSPRRDRKSETITRESTGRSSRRARRRRGIPQRCPAPQLWQSGRRARRYSIGDEPGGARIRGTRPPSHSAQGRVFPRSPFSLARRKASASAPPPDCAAPLRGADAFAELRRPSRDDPFASFLPPVSSSRRSVSATRLRATSTSSTFTLTMSPGLTTWRGSLMKVFDIAEM